MDDSDDPVVLKRSNTTTASLRCSARVQKQKDEQRSKLKSLQDKRSKSLAAKFILGESSVTYRPPQGYYGNFGAKESNVKGSAVVDDDEEDEEDMDQNTSSEEYVRLRKPKKGFMNNEIVFSEDDNLSHDETLSNNLQIAESTIDGALNAVAKLNKTNFLDDNKLNKDKRDVQKRKEEGDINKQQKYREVQDQRENHDVQDQKENRDIQNRPQLIKTDDSGKQYFYDPMWRE